MDFFHALSPSLPLTPPLSHGVPHLLSLLLLFFLFVVQHHEMRSADINGLVGMFKEDFSVDAYFK